MHEHYSIYKTYKGDIYNLCLYKIVLGDGMATTLRASLPLETEAESRWECLPGRCFSPGKCFALQELVVWGAVCTCLSLAPGTRLAIPHLGMLETTGK